LLPWEVKAPFRAAKACFKDWLRTRGTTGAMEDKALIDRTRLFLTEHGASRFQDLNEGTATSFPVRDRVGFKVSTKEGLLYLFPKENFLKEICKGLDPTRAAAVLHRHGMLKRDKNGYKVKPPRRLPGIGRERCFAIIMANENE
jgi:uncharacterized protein (DUF927 family)